MSPQNPLSDIAELFGKEGPVRKDLNNLSNKLEDLTVELEELVKTLSKRAGVDKEDKDKDKESKGKGTQPKRRLSTKNPRDPYSDENTPRTLKNDFIGLKRGLADSLINNPMRYVTGKSSLPENIDKLVPNEPQTSEDTINKITDPKKSEDTINKITENQQSEDKEVIQSDSKDIPNKMVDQLTANDSNITKLEPKENQQSEDTINKIAEEKLNTTNKEDTPIEDNNNKVLNDMVGVLIDIRDDKSQKLLLTEATAIRQLLTNQNKITPASSGIEPNTNEAKQEDRELLAEAIARRLGEVLQASGLGSNSGIPMGLDFPDGPDRNKPKTPPTGKPKIPSGGAGKMGNMLKGGAGLAMLGRGITGAAVDYGLGELGVGKDADGEDLQIDEKQDDENWNKMTIAEKMQSGLARGIEKAGSVTFLDNIAREAQTNRIKNETNYLKDRKVEAPVGETDAQARLRIDRENEDREEARIEAKGSGTYVGNEKLVSGQPLSDKQMRTIELSKSMGNSPAIEPKSTENNIGTILNKVSDQNTELKMFNMDKSETQMLAPIVSNKTINNTEQTFVGSPPTPHPSTNSFLRWQSSRSGYTD